MNNRQIEDPQSLLRTKLAEERTRLALERTYSAWLRTGLAGLGGGFTLIQLIPYETIAQKITGETLGLILVFWGIGIFIFSLLQFEKGAKLRKAKGIEVPIWYIRLISFSLIGISLLLVLISKIPLFFINS